MLVLLTGCATTRTVTGPEKPVEVKSIMQKEFDTLPPPAGKAITVAVYTFIDKTGQRRPAPNFANLSSAVTQGSEAFLIN